MGTRNVVVTNTAPGGGKDSLTAAFTIDATSPTSVEQLAGIPTEYQLYQNFPNPFNPSTTIRLDLPEASNVTVAIYDVTGKHVSSLLMGEHGAGTYQAQWSAERNPSGVYFVRLQAQSLSSQRQFQSLRKIVLLK